MTAPAPKIDRSTRPQKLAIIHLLGWMVGVGAVLAIYRATTVEADVSEDWLLTMRLACAVAA